MLLGTNANEHSSNNECSADLPPFCAAMVPGSRPSRRVESRAERVTCRGAGDSEQTGRRVVWLRKYCQLRRGMAATRLDTRGVEANLERQHSPTCRCLLGRLKAETATSRGAAASLIHPLNANPTRRQAQPHMCGTPANVGPCVDSSPTWVPRYYDSVPRCDSRWLSI